MNSLIIYQQSQKEKQLYNTLQQKHMYSHNPSNLDLTYTSSELIPSDSEDESLDLHYCAAVDESIPDITALQLPFSTSSANEIYSAHLGDFTHLQIARNENSAAITFDNFLNQLSQLQNQGFLTLRKKDEAQLKLKLCRQDKTCAICHELVKKKSVIYQTKCKHIYHRDCLHSWRKVKNNCPLCRKQLS